MDSMKHLQKEQKKIFSLVKAFKTPYYLTGGTALAFHFGHRFSEDLDFFTQKYKKTDPDKIMKHIKEKTKYTYSLINELNEQGLVPLKSFQLELGKGASLKIDFVSDFTHNIQKIKGGIHSPEDIYYRKICVTLGKKAGMTDDVGRIISIGRQTVKDLLDIYYLSKRIEPLHKFFLRYFAPNAFEYVESWYRGFNRMEAKLEMPYYAPTIDPGDIFRYLDKEILQKYRREDV